MPNSEWKLLLSLRFCRRCLKWKQWNLPADMACEVTWLSIWAVRVKSLSKSPASTKSEKKHLRSIERNFAGMFLIAQYEYMRQWSPPSIASPFLLVLRLDGFGVTGDYCHFKFQMADGEMLSETSDAHNEGKESDSQSMAATARPSTSKSNPQGITVFCRLRPVPKVLACSMFLHDRLYMFSSHDPSLLLLLYSHRSIIQ